MNVAEFDAINNATDTESVPDTNDAAEAPEPAPSTPDTSQEDQAPEAPIAQDPIVSVLAHSRVVAWPPAEQDPGESGHEPLSFVLAEKFTGDGHFTAYSRQDVHPRLKIEALRTIGSVPMVAMIFDVDCATSHRATGGSGDNPAPDAWFEEEKKKLPAILAKYGTPFVYRTRGGYRLVFRLAVPFEVTESTQKMWSAFYIRCCAYLAREFNIVADPACSDWTHLYRAPHATRGPAGSDPEQLEIIGDPANIALWDYVPPDDPEQDLATAAELAVGDAGWAKRGFSSLQRLLGTSRSTSSPRSKARNKPATAGAPVPIGAIESDEPHWPPLEERVARARQYISKRPGAVSGEAGHSTTFTVAIILVRGFALPLEVALQILEEDFNPRCSPPWTHEELVHKIEDAAKAEGPRGFLLASESERPQVVISTQEFETGDQAVAALALDPHLYVRGGSLVHVVSEEAPKSVEGIVRPAAAARILRATQPHLRERLTAVADIRKFNEEKHELVRAHPPEWLVQAAAARGSWPRMRKLLAVLETPVLRPDGSIVNKPGYDETTGILFVPGAKFLEVSDAPTTKDVEDAVYVLKDILSDFPFATETHRAAAVAAMLNPFFRFAYTGPTPAVVIDATTAGTGKGLLVDVIAHVALGHAMPRMPQARDEAEEGKRIMAIALSGDLQVLVDNLTRPLGSGALDAVLTAVEWNDRILGASEMVRMPMLTQWYFTGNNVQLANDTSRRVLMVRMESMLEQPELRKGFRYPDLLGWVRDVREEIVHAVLTIGRAFFLAGAPTKGKPWGSFEGWSNTVRAAVVFAGFEDPGDTRDLGITRADVESESIAALFTGIVSVCQKRGVTAVSAGEIVDHIVTHPPHSALASAASELARLPAFQTPTAEKLGYVLRRFKGRVIGGRRLNGHKVGGAVLWSVETVGPLLASPSDDGDGGDVPATSGLDQDEGGESGSPPPPSDDGGDEGDDPSISRMESEDEGTHVPLGDSADHGDAAAAQTHGGGPEHHLDHRHRQPGGGPGSESPTEGRSR